MASASDPGSGDGTPAGIVFRRVIAIQLAVQQSLVAQWPEACEKEGHMRMRNILRHAVLGAVAVLVLGVAAGAADVPPDALTDARFYTGSTGNLGVFPGKIVCLCCDFQTGNAAKEPCKEQHHKYGLKIPGDPTVHPLIPGDALVMKQLASADLHGKQVSVNGNLFPGVGVILVASITTQ
jgi:hypothetical protein